MANIKVAVRVRPISARESNLTGSEVVVHTESNEISLTNLKVSSSKAGDSRERIRKYGFDYCFDSSNPVAQNFADQATIYQTLGRTVLDNVFTGYNSCLVAYGQSASGKTYTMMGTKEDPGLTPRLCEGIFARIEEERRNERNYGVSVRFDASRGAHPGLVDVLRGGGDEGTEDSVHVAEPEQQPKPRSAHDRGRRGKRRSVVLEEEEAVPRRQQAASRRSGGERERGYLRWRSSTEGEPSNLHP